MYNSHVFENENENKSIPSCQITCFEQCTYIRIKGLGGKTSREIHTAMMEACGTSAVGFTIVKRQCKLFMEGCGEVEDIERSRCPATVHNDKTNAVIIATLLDQYRRMKVREMKAERGILKTS